MRHRVRWLLEKREFVVELSGEGEFEEGKLRIFDPRIMISERDGYDSIEMGLETFLEISNIVKDWVEKFL